MKNDKIIEVKIFGVIECHICKGSGTNTDFSGREVGCSRCDSTGRLEKRLSVGDLFFESLIWLLEKTRPKNAK
ncbi:MAG: hypothetical protein R3251_00995 [Candidatus Spechtbacterales bacterium]|nr:hypothetical protein [Candidatus Spechtbacterales bacterium]